jgi:hypothetical protein
LNFFMILFITFTIIIILWICLSYFSSRVKEPGFKLLKRKNGYEIRQYAQYIEAQVKVSGSYSESQNKGFRILAGYIFGGNRSKKSITMTAPVLEQSTGEKISMTAPVLETADDNGERIISFVMPSGYSIESLPIPNDKRVEFVVVAGHKSAVLKYSWGANTTRVEEKKSKLLAYAKRDGLKIIGQPKGARYNPPWTIPFMLRNEIIIDIDYKNNP